MKEGHTHHGTSNTPEVFTSCIGCTVKGMYREHSEYETRVLVFDCGYGLALCSTGAYWTVSPADVQRALTVHRKVLEQTTRELQDILTLAGEPQ